MLALPTMQNRHVCLVAPEALAQLKPVFREGGRVLDTRDGGDGALRMERKKRDERGR